MTRVNSPSQSDLPGRSRPRRVLIVSSHPLFGKGIQRLLQTRGRGDVQVVGIVDSVDAAMQAQETLKPDLVVVDYDDGAVNREEYLARFVEGASQMRLVLFSLKEGGSEAIVYDRRALAASQVDDWLASWDVSPDFSEREGSKGRPSRKPEDRRPLMKNIHPIGALIFVAVLMTLGLLVLRANVLLPPADSAQAVPIDQLFGYHFILIAFLFALITGIILYSVIFFRQKPGEVAPVYKKDDESLNIQWIIFPLAAVFSYIFLQAIPAFKDLYALLLVASLLPYPIVSAAVAALIGVVVYFAVFPPGRKADGYGEPAKENSRLELAWTALPLVVVLGFSLVGSSALAQTMRPDPKALRIKVIGQQWSWRFEYPDLGIISTDLILQENKQAVLSLTSLDVIHSFWVPEFRVKQDAVPGIVRDLRITPTEIGEYRLICSELCGKQHWSMVAPVKVMSAADFEAWVNSQALPEDPEGRGQVWYTQFGCKACHTLDGTKLVGPSFKGLYGSETELEDGSKVTVDDAYITNSIRNPAAQIVKGFPNAMPPNIGEKITDEQISDLIAFIKTLK